MGWVERLNPHDLSGTQTLLVPWQRAKRPLKGLAMKCLGLEVKLFTSTHNPWARTSLLTTRSLDNAALLWAESGKNWNYLTNSTND